jgi:hypothetical protein
MTRGGRIAALGAVCIAIFVVLLRHERTPTAHEHPPAAAEEASAVPVSTAATTSRATPPPASRASAGALDRPATEDEFMRELMQLESTDKEAALALARKGEGWYSSSGKPAEARKAMIVTLLADLNRMDEARTLARAFMAAFPGSEYLPLVQGATGIHPRPHGPNGVVY